MQSNSKIIVGNSNFLARKASKNSKSSDIRKKWHVTNGGNLAVPIFTDMTHPEGMDELFEKYVAPAAAKIPLERLGNIDDIANGVLYLASDASEWVTGHSILIGGGELA